MIIDKPIQDIKGKMNTKERFSIIQVTENKTFFHNEILVINKDIENRGNVLNFERVLDQIEFDFKHYFKTDEEHAFTLFHLLKSCLRFLNKDRLNDAKQKLIDYAICMVKEQDLREQGK